MLITNQTFYYSKINFGTTNRRHTAGPDREIVYNYTKVEREDLDFKNLAKLISETFRDLPKVDIYSMACSDGSEAYTLAMHLKEILTESEAKKLFPIKCTDNDGIIISCASNNKLNMEDSDLKALSKNGIDYNKYFKLSDKKMIIPADKLEKYETYETKDSLKGSVEFCRKTILQQVEQMDKNTPKVILCRNVLPYIGTTLDELRHLDKICEKLLKNDILVLGDYDRGLSIINTLKTKNLQEVMKNVFMKVK